MSILSGRLTASSGLSPAGSAGAYSSPAYGGNSTMYPATSTGQGFMSGAYGNVSVGVGNLFEGKLSLATLEVIVLALVGFYIWTHNIQGGG